MAKHRAPKARWPVSAGGFPAAGRSRYRNPTAAAGTAVSGAVGLTMIVVAAGATLLGQPQSVSGSPLAVGHSQTVDPQAGPAPVAVPDTGATSTTAVPPPPPSSQQAPQPPAPNTVLLPKGGRSSLVRSGVAGDGTLQIPNGVTKAALWGAALNGNAGATLIAGHINWEGVAGPFAELWGAQAGQTVTVVDEHGQQLKFVVDQVLTVDKDNLPQHADELFGQTGPHRLVLVTCGGKWVGGALGYDQNRVVIAHPVS
ncbi:class F sortase [Kutzneria sp. NPDC052558]|uniref:class F sortase n=1 Tax=Kutzneria sp. NPDC052558 TaxID=3364121 RepID=UPI0037C8918A